MDSTFLSYMKRDTFTVLYLLIARCLRYAAQLSSEDKTPYTMQVITQIPRVVWTPNIGAH